MIEEEMRKRAEERGVECTGYLPKIAKAREKMKIGLYICPCAPDDKDRGCISAKCLQEIKEQGHCHCNAYKWY